MNRASAGDARGAGGDPDLLDVLSREGLDLGAIGAVPLPSLRAALDRAAPGVARSVVVYRGRLVHNLTRRGVAGFLVSAHGAPASRGLLQAPSGRDVVPAATDPDGRFTFVGLPRNVETTLSLKRPGFLQLAFTMRTSHPFDYEQDDVATVQAALARRAYDARHPFAAFEGGPDRGEMAFTLVRERRAPDDPLRGLVSPGMYAGNGVEGARIRVFTDPEGAGRFDVPYPDTGLVYADSLEAVLGRGLGGTGRRLARLASRAGLGRLVARLEMPAPWRAESSRLGLAILKSMPPGIYEAEAAHASLDCLPTRDAWPATTPRRVRFEVLRNTLGDVRFTCEERRP